MRMVGASRSIVCGMDGAARKSLPFGPCSAIGRISLPHWSAVVGGLPVKTADAPAAASSTVRTSTRRVLESKLERTLPAQPRKAVAASAGLLAACQRRNLRVPAGL